MTGPAVSGFGSINDLHRISVDLQAEKKVTKDKVFISATIRNATTSLAFFTQLKIKDSKGRIIKPAYYTDNFFSLLPGEKKSIQIEVPKDSMEGNTIRLLLDGQNVNEIEKDFVF